MATLKPPPSPEWQRSTREIVNTCKRRLWSVAGHVALTWLRDRGLNDETIKAARLGYNPVDTNFAGLFVPAGIILPWFDRRQLRMVNVRRLDRLPKYQVVAGSVKGGVYPDSDLHAGRPVVICEGEFDSLLIRQEAGDVVQAITLGSASDRPTSNILGALVSCPVVLLGFDADPAGDKAAADWRDLIQRAKRSPPPVGKDWTEVHKAGRNLRSIFKAELRKAERLR